MSTTAPITKLPWYRYRAVWLLISGPAIVVVAGFITLFIAWHSEDGLVADDYYKRGLAINRTLAREARAQALHLSASLQLDNDRVVVQLTGAPDAAPVMLRFVHPARADRDRAIALPASAQGRFEAALPALAPGRWGVVLEADAWRLEGDIDVPAEKSIVLKVHSAVGE